jgi:hypothetical protein
MNRKGYYSSDNGDSMKDNSEEKVEPFAITVRFGKLTSQRIKNLSQKEMRSINMTVNILVKEGLKAQKT